MSHHQQTVAETIETLTERLQTSTLLEDRRDASRALRSLAKDYRVEVCAQAMEALLASIRTDRHDVELVNHCLDSLNYIISGPLADSPAATWADSESDLSQNAPVMSRGDTLVSTVDNGRELAEIFLKKADNVITILDTVLDNDFKTRWVAVRLLCGLTRQKLAAVQHSILLVPDGFPRLVQLITEEQELIRNDALVLFVRLTQNNQDVQKLLAFGDCFDKLMYIIEFEGYLDGTVAVVMDCLNILLNLIHQNEQTQVLFREGAHIKKLLPFFNSPKDIHWTNEKTTCLILVLRILDYLVTFHSSPAHVRACQSIMQRCGLLDRLCELLTAQALPIGVLSEAINTASDIVRGNLDGSMVMQTSAIMPVLLLSQVKEMCQDQEKKILDLYSYAQVLYEAMKNNSANTNNQTTTTTSSNHQPDMNNTSSTHHTGMS